MLPSICRRLVSLPLKIGSMTDLSNTRLQLIQINASIITIKPFSSSTSPSGKEDGAEKEKPFVVSYLINYCGLSRDRAIYTASLTGKKLKFKNPEGPDKVLTFFKIQGFTDTQITRIVTKQPLLLTYRNPEELFLPKMEFFYSIGFPKSHLLDFLSYNPPILSLSLERNIIPAYDFLKSVLVSNERAIYALRRSSWVFTSNHTNTLIPNIELLRKIGVTASSIALLLANFPRTLLLKHTELRKCVDEVTEMGFDVSKSMFVCGLYALSSKSNKAIRERCIEVYKSWGWSDDDILSAFRKFPQCMLLSEKKIVQIMDFLVNKMGRRAGEIVEFPVALGSSLERKLIPRCAVIRVLQSKGLVKKWRLSTVVLPSKEDFLRRFVTKFSEEAPELLSVYEGKMDVFKE